jgi:hypothetical protein
MGVFFVIKRAMMEIIFNLKIILIYVVSKLILIPNDERPLKMINTSLDN